MSCKKRKEWFYESKANGNGCDADCDVCGSQPVFDQFRQYENNTGTVCPLLLEQLYLGPLDGFLIGFFGSFLNQLLTFGLTPTTILWVIPAAVRGLLIGL